METKSLYAFLNFLGCITLFVTVICDLLGVNGVNVFELVRAANSSMATTKWSYAINLGFLGLWLLWFTFDQLRKKYRLAENRSLEDLGLKMFLTEVLLSFAYVCFDYRQNIIACIASGVSIPLLCSAYFVFSFHSKGRTRLELFVWSTLIGFMLMFSLFLFGAILSVTIGKIGRAETWFYVIGTVICLSSILCYSFLSPSPLVSIFSGMFFAGIGVVHIDETMMATIAFVYAAIPVVISIVMFLCLKCKY